MGFLEVFTVAYSYQTTCTECCLSDFSRAGAGSEPDTFA